MPLSAINGAFKRALREHLIVNIKRAQEKEQLRGPKRRSEAPCPIAIGACFSEESGVI